MDNMKAYQLLAKLRCLTLAGYEDGQYVWIGKDKDWSKVEYEEESIMRDRSITKLNERISRKS